MKIYPNAPKVLISAKISTGKSLTKFIFTFNAVFSFAGKTIHNEYSGLIGPPGVNITLNILFLAIIFGKCFNAHSVLTHGVFAPGSANIQVLTVSPFSNRIGT